MMQREEVARMREAQNVIVNSQLQSQAAHSHLVYSIRAALNHSSPKQAMQRLFPHVNANVLELIYQGCGTSVEQTVAQLVQAAGAAPGRINWPTTAFCPPRSSVDSTLYADTAYRGPVHLPAVSALLSRDVTPLASPSSGVQQAGDRRLIPAPHHITHAASAFSAPTRYSSRDSRPDAAGSEVGGSKVEESVPSSHSSVIASPLRAADCPSLPSSSLTNTALCSSTSVVPKKHIKFSVESIIGLS